MCIIYIGSSSNIHFFISGIPLRCKSFDSVQKGSPLTLLSSQHSAPEPSEHNSSNICVTTTRQTQSTHCLLSSEPAYSTSARLTDHFPEKLLTPSNSLRVFIDKSADKPAIQVTQDISSPPTQSEHSQEDNVTNSSAEASQTSSTDQVHG